MTRYACSLVSPEPPPGYPEDLWADVGTHLAVDTVALRQHVLLEEKKLKRNRRLQQEPIVLNMKRQRSGYNL